MHTAARNPFSATFACLRKPEGNAPKKIPAYLLYGSDNVALVIASCIKGANISERNKKAKELFDKESPEVQEKYIEAAAKKYEVEIEKYRNASSGAPSSDPEEQSMARECLSTAMSTMFNVIAQHTSYTNLTLGEAPIPSAGTDDAPGLHLTFPSTSAISRQEQHVPAVVQPPTIPPTHPSTPPAEQDDNTMDDEAFTQELSEALLCKLTKLLDAARKTELRRLRELKEIELDRKNNIATNQERLATFGLSDAASLFQKLPKPTPWLRAILRDSVSASSNSSIRSDHGISTGGLTVSATFSSSSTSSDVIPNVAHLRGTPGWLAEQYHLLAAVEMPMDQREVWLAVLKMWLELEDSAFRQLPALLISPSGFRRPINSSWFRRTLTLISSTEDWSVMFKSGRNGFLTVLASLAGLREAMRESEWNAALADVQWVINQVLQAKMACDTKRVQVDDHKSKNEVLKVPAAKRPRRGRG
ncbi:hypothetical protein NM688_g3915 [Phlebia brevispora]|uniref:Uncharacterized protein n=1 Tax=Phlebia brevispora TaxID=194682 RepID=A0ACC1T480_9APHY|nr:hypothetical protein NM688_g3915 [Phlebia brevispora]